MDYTTLDKENATLHERRCALAMEIYHAGSWLLAHGMPDYRPVRLQVESATIGSAFCGAIEMQLMHRLGSEETFRLTDTSEEERRQSIFDAGDRLMAAEAGRNRFGKDDPITDKERTEARKRRDAIPMPTVDIPHVVAELTLSTSIQLMGVYHAYFQGVAAGDKAAKHMAKKATQTDPNAEKAGKRHLN